jgi:8-oxo-(d)GTP phosphatase
MNAFVDMPHNYHVTLNGQAGNVKASELYGDVLVINPAVVLVYKLFTIMRVKKLKKLHSLTFVTDNKKTLINTIKSQFKVIKAAGGLVFKDDKILLMYRLNKWDLPKGKLDKDEKSSAGAVREVEEECNIKVQLHEKICSTWHTYTLNGSKIIKKTKWYLMTCLDDSQMQPQVEEDIEKLVWVDRQEAEALLSTSYQSIQFVLGCYLQSQDVLPG